MNECYGNYFIHNGIVKPASLFDNSMVYEGEAVYEVLRMKKGLPYFFEDHIQRLENSTRLQKKNMLATIDQIRDDIIKLSQLEKVKEVNLKIVFNYSEPSGNYFLYYIEPVYPTSEQYSNGVKGIFFFAERINPESKVINHKLRSEIYHKLIVEKAYEALLVNKEGLITEGSRSNIFFIKGDELFTAPDKFVLAGITRKYILEICNDFNISVIHECVKLSEVSNYESVFMTGTSPIVLPFNIIDNIPFNVNHYLMSFLRNIYLERAEKSLEYFM
ncbi:MAG: aminotransferase class IV family protein [Bacteroidales bacterium]|nr:aminotransferase class IV family protein [Bacteroidales bacterium]